MNLYKLSSTLFKKSSTSWPTATEELLIKAALLKGSEALNAWQDWKSRIALNQTDDNSQNLFPLLYKNLLNLGVEDTSIDVIKHFYRVTEVKTNFLFNIARKPIQILKEEGIQTMLLKGAALSKRYYQDPGLRPMLDVDVLVPPHQANAAITILKDLGWKSNRRLQKPLEEPYLSYMPSAGFEDAAEFSFDINWHLINLNCSFEADKAYWADARIIDFEGAPVLVLNPTYQLLHVCVHGMTHIPMSIKWIPDAWMVLNRSGSEIDWELLLAHIQEAKIVSLMRDTLLYLNRLLNPPIPDRILAGLQDIPVGVYEQREYYAVTGRSNEMGSLPLLWVLYHRRTRAQKERGLQTLTFFQYLELGWGLENIWQVPFRFVFMVYKRILNNFKTKIS